MKYFLVNKNTESEIIKSLEKYGDCVPLPSFDALPEPVSQHPDMLIAKIGDTYITHHKYYPAIETLGSLKLKYVLSSADVGKKYPDDIALNCFTVKNFFFADLLHVSQDALELAESQCFKPVHVKQGYAKCSACIIKDAIITSDISIYKAAVENGIDALLIPPGNIGIEKYGFGFIGGASGSINEGIIGFFGDIDLHPAGDKIRQFCFIHETEIISLNHKALFDYGGFISLDA